MADAAAASRLPGIALTLYGPEGRPIAWAGRPAPIPDPALQRARTRCFSRQDRARACAWSRVKPVVDPAAIDRRVATIVAEAALPATPGVRAARRRLSARDEHRAASLFAPASKAHRMRSADAIVVRSQTGDPIAAVDRAGERDRSRARPLAHAHACGRIAWSSLPCCLLLVGPLLDWRRPFRSIAAHVVAERRDSGPAPRRASGVVGGAAAGRSRRPRALASRTSRGPLLDRARVAARFSVYLAARRRHRCARGVELRAMALWAAVAGPRDRRTPPAAHRRRLSSRKSPRARPPADSSSRTSRSSATRLSQSSIDHPALLAASVRCRRGWRSSSGW